MDKLVKRVTIVERSGQTREAKVVYNLNDEDDDEEGMPSLHNLERSVRHLLKADLIAAQEAYQRHLASLEKGGSAWLNEGPRNLMRAQRKAMKEASKASPFGSVKVHIDEDDEED